MNESKKTSQETQSIHQLPRLELAPPERRGRWKRVGGRRRVITAIIALVLLAAIFYRLWPKKAEEEEKENIVVSVQVARAERHPIAAKTTALGTIFPRQQATISAKISAPILQMNLLKNKLVRQGEVIAVLEARDLKAQRTEADAALQEARHALAGLNSGAIPQATAQAEKDLRDAQANLENAKAIYERRRELYERGGIAKRDLEAAQLALTTAEGQMRLAESAAKLRISAINPNDRAQAEAKVKQAEERRAWLDAQLSYADIRAPFTGVITDQFQYKGEYAAAGAKLVNIADISEIIVKAPFADTVAAQLKVGDPAEVQPTDLPGQSIAGHISLVSRAGDPANRTIEVWINLGNKAGQLHANGTAQVVVTTRTAQDAIVVPTAAVVLDASNAESGKVMTVDDKFIAHETKVTIGIHTADFTEITSGLKGGELVVVEGNYSLPDETKVQIGTEGKEDKNEEGKGEKKESQEGERDSDEKKEPGVKSGEKH